MWTPSALASEFQAYDERVWRVVEAQHRISTNRLAPSLEDQRILEELADAVKPELPREARHLHYLLASPFRYGHRSASRFRRANERPGIFYSSEHEETAIAETAYWRLRFLSRSPGLTPPSRACDAAAPPRQPVCRASTAAASSAPSRSAADPTPERGPEPRVLFRQRTRAFLAK